MSPAAYHLAKLPPEFPYPPRVEWTGPRRGVFKEPFVFLSPSLGRIIIEAGFDTDYASVPRGLWNLYPPDGSYSPAAWIHDWLYWHQPCEREQADKVFLEGMKALGIGWFTRGVLYRAVRMGGGAAWEANRRARLNLPEEDRATPAHMKKHFHKLRR